jgi:hypothetical protein
MTEGGPMSIDGKWQLVIDSPIGKQHLALDLKESGGDLSGALINESKNVTTDIFDGRVEGDLLQWKAKLRQLNITVSFSTTIQDDTMTGKVKAGLFGSFEVVGTRG